MSSFKVTVGHARPVRVKNFRDARSVIAAAVTNLMTRDPESVARAATTINEAFTSGAAEHSLTAHGRWSTTMTVNGEPVPLTIVKQRW